ncbi:hypothetical protein F5Y18DRAFT_380270, partial [Xylariaceae sp. FL1019]
AVRKSTALLEGPMVTAGSCHSLISGFQVSTEVMVEPSGSCQVILEILILLVDGCQGVIFSAFGGGREGLLKALDSVVLVLVGSCQSVIFDLKVIVELLDSLIADLVGSCHLRAYCVHGLVDSCQSRLKSLKVRLKLLDHHVGSCQVGIFGLQYVME